jgi:hypothetical protein
MNHWPVSQQNTNCRNIATYPFSISKEESRKNFKKRLQTGYYLP